MSTYEIKRRQFNIIEEIDETSKKVERKGKYFYLKHYSDASEMNKVLKINKILSVNGIQVPSVRYINKNNNDVLFDYIEGEPVINELQYGDLKEPIYEELFRMYWRCKQERITLLFDPSNFKFYKEKLYYLKPTYSLVQDLVKGQEEFLNRTLRLWFYSKESVALLKEKGLKTEGVLEEEYATNKRMTLMSVKYYK